MNKERQHQLETVLAAGIAFGVKGLVIDRFIGDTPPEQRGFKDDVARALTTALATVLASAIVRQFARSRWGS